MKEQLQSIKDSALGAVNGCSDLKELDALRVKYLGKKGELTAILKQMGGLSAEERPIIGQLANDVRTAIESAIKDKSDALKSADAIEDNAVTVAYSYIGPKITHPMYFEGSIGRAKAHLYETSKKLTEKYSASGLKAYISVNKALVTQSSAAIPIVPLYISILYKVMKAKGVHEGCIEQMYRLFNQKLYAGAPVVDEQGMIRLDDLEMEQGIQDEVSKIWEELNADNFKEYTDIDGYWSDFYELFGFGIDGVDYDADVEV